MWSSGVTGGARTAFGLGSRDHRRRWIERACPHRRLLRIVDAQRTLAVRTRWWPSGGATGRTARASRLWCSSTSTRTRSPLSRTRDASRGGSRSTVSAETIAFMKLAEPFVSRPGFIDGSTCVRGELNPVRPTDGTAAIDVRRSSVAVTHLPRGIGLRLWWATQRPVRSRFDAPELGSSLGASRITTTFQRESCACRVPSVLLLRSVAAHAGARHAMPAAADHTSGADVGCGGGEPSGRAGLSRGLAARSALTRSWPSTPTMTYGRHSFDLPAGELGSTRSRSTTHGTRTTVRVPLRDGRQHRAARSGADSSVKFYYSHGSHWITDNREQPDRDGARVRSRRRWAAGATGIPACLRSWLQDRRRRRHVHLQRRQLLPAGSYEAKAAIDESWDENYGVGWCCRRRQHPVRASAADGDAVTFTFVSATNRRPVRHRPLPTDRRRLRR